ncbi:peptide deformylase [Xylanimonas protaetiae]|uniref:Peptide deformylase n=1 Tax=Xylanimonas protaetiae TaxID=2509457 RepID=A0A4P6F700_9MICO|nr:peptide deformylase [Xylanimonas protaetiae]QAY70119.1 peptide deformylase [Xylanimonas protaetiae]
MSTGFGGPVDDELYRTVADRLRAAGPTGVLPIVQSGDPVLRTPVAPYTGQLGDLLPRLAEVMRRTMHAAPGVGLAATQVGIGLALAVVEDRGNETDPRERTPLPFRLLVNPAYEPVEEEDGGAPRRVPFFEGCLSVEGWHALVARHHRVRLTAQDVDGAPVDEVLTGWPARIIQHETDHLHGELYLDHAVPRSLVSNANLVSLWGGAPDPAPVAAALGFEVP